ncbi:TPA: hypothetical protein ACJ81N_000046 [Streptococcus pneumoniae]
MENSSIDVDMLLEELTQEAMVVVALLIRTVNLNLWQYMKGYWMF